MEHTETRLEGGDHRKAGPFKGVWNRDTPTGGPPGGRSSGGRTPKQFGLRPSRGPPFLIVPIGNSRRLVCRRRIQKSAANGRVNRGPTSSQLGYRGGPTSKGAHEHPLGQAGRAHEGPRAKKFWILDLWLERPFLGYLRHLGLSTGFYFLAEL